MRIQSAPSVHIISKALPATELPLTASSLAMLNDGLHLSSASKVGAFGASHIGATILKQGVALLASDLLVRRIYPEKHDKRLHAVAGGLISGVVGEIAAKVTGSPWKGALIGIAAGTLAGIGKEVVDLMGYGEPDIHDFYATALGAITVGASVTISF